MLSCVAVPELRFALTRHQIVVFLHDLCRQFKQPQIVLVHFVDAEDKLLAVLRLRFELLWVECRLAFMVDRTGRVPYEIDVEFRMSNRFKTLLRTRIVEVLLNDV